MKVIVVFALFTLAVADSEYYTTPNDHLDMDKFFADRENVQLYVDCFLERGPCSEVQQNYKKNIADAVQQTCKKCNANQKYIFYRLLTGLKESMPDAYKLFKDHYDPESKYFGVLENELSKYTKPTAD